MNVPEASDVKPPENGDGPLPGSVSEQFIRCGKPGCRCCTGHLHGPYYYRTWRGEDRTVHKVYVKRAGLEQVRARCERHRALAEEFRALHVERRAVSARLRVQSTRSRCLRASSALARTAGSRRGRGPANE